MWSYTFADYDHFTAGTNAVSPRPNWQSLSFDVNVPISTTPPLNEYDYNAFEFSLWKQFGTDVLIKSNINNWLVCSPDVGSFVDWQYGAINCKIARRISEASCEDGSPPTHFDKGVSSCGPLLRRNGAYYYFDSCSGINFPTHDPCGENNDNGLKNVKNPHGNIFLR